MANPTDQLAQAATSFANAGRWREAEDTWRELHHLNPADQRALFGLGIHALQRGDVEVAVRFLSEACEASPTDLFALLALAKARQAANDPQGEIKAIEQALCVDAYYLPGLLAKAAFIERNGKPAAAAYAYSNALKVAPPRSQWPDMLCAQLEHARAFSDRHAEESSAYLTRELAPMLQSLDPL